MFFSVPLISSFLLEEGLTESLPEATSLPPVALACKSFRVSSTTPPGIGSLSPHYSSLDDNCNNQYDSQQNSNSFKCPSDYFFFHAGHLQMFREKHLDICKVKGTILAFNGENYS